VRQIVTRFGKQLKSVSTLAPPDDIRRAVKAQYAELITSRLLRKWLADPHSVPGRDVSSPWPKGIDVERIHCASPSRCEAKGDVIYITSNEVEHGGVAARRAISLSLQRTSSGWRITSVDMGG
jgi:hypothetical protein